MLPRDGARESISFREKAQPADAQAHSYLCAREGSAVSWRRRQGVSHNAESCLPLRDQSRYPRVELAAPSLGLNCNRFGAEIRAETMSPH